MRGKRSKKDVQEFEHDLMSNIISLHRDLAAKTYEHSAYEFFRISDPKPRDIHKAKVRDRLLHHAIHRKLYPFFNKTFIADSFSCRLKKGTHRAIDRFRTFSYKVSENHTKTVWVLKCDIRKFFASVDQAILLGILNNYIKDKDILMLLSKVVGSFYSTEKGVGLPLGNLTSQLFVNIYMNEFDQFVKHRLKTKYYIRYADDFVAMSQDRAYLNGVLALMQEFLCQNLKLEMHPKKVSVTTVASGVDFLGWVHFPHHRVLRTVTKKRMLRNIQAKADKTETAQSYLGMLKHGNGWKLRQDVVAKSSLARGYFLC